MFRIKEKIENNKTKKMLRKHEERLTSKDIERIFLKT